MKLTRLLLAALVVLSACNNDTLDVDLDDFPSLARFEKLDLSRITPAGDPRYWELRFSWGPHEDRDSVIASGGRDPRAQLASPIRMDLDSIRAQTGFAMGCLPAFCFMYVVAVHNTSVTVYDSVDELVTFLGTIDNVEEAALLTRAHGFYWDDNDQTGARAAANGWEFVVLELVRSCSPVQTDRVHLLVQRDGAIRVLGREVYEKLENACV